MRRNRTIKSLLAVALLSAATLASFVSTARTLPQNREVERGFELTAKHGEEETRIDAFYGSGVYKITATDAAGTRAFKLVKAGERLAQPCAAAERSCETIKVEGTDSYKVCFCKSTTALLLPAVQRVREIPHGGGGGGGGGGGDGGGSGSGPLCTQQKPCCYEDEKLQMSICHPSL